VIELKAGNYRRSAAGWKALTVSRAPANPANLNAL
jgi:hypothetical protein